MFVLLSPPPRNGKASSAIWTNYFLKQGISLHRSIFGTVRMKAGRTRMFSERMSRGLTITRAASLESLFRRMPIREDIAVCFDVT